MILRSPGRSKRNAKISSRRRALGRVRERGTDRAELPGPIYCDASALLKLYLAESGSAEFNRVVEGRRDLLVSDLAVTEIVSALSRRMRHGDLTQASARRLGRTLVAHVDDGTYQRVEAGREVHRRAEHFLVSLTDTPLRAPHALHLALALSARAMSMASFDAKLRSAAVAVGLTTYPG